MRGLYQNQNQLYRQGKNKFLSKTNFFDSNYLIIKKMKFSVVIPLQN